MLYYQFDRSLGILTLKPQGPLEKRDFMALRLEIDPYIKAHGVLRGVLIESSGFPLWKNFEALVSHFRFIEEHHRKVERVGVVTDDTVLAVLPALAKHFVSAELRHFKVSERGKAEAWVRHPEGRGLPRPSQSTEGSRPSPSGE
jgi:hypothetical protein